MSCSCGNRKTVRSEADKKRLRSRLNRIKGQLEGVGRMVESDAYCDDVLIQLSAIAKSVKSLANLVLEKHMFGCVVEDIKRGDTEILGEIINLFKRFQ